MSDAGLGHPSSERGWLVEMEQRPAAWSWVERVGETGLDAGALVEERQRSERGREAHWQASGIFLRLRLNASERFALALRLDDANGLPIHVEQIVGVAVAR